MSLTPCERWVWVELIGFDNTRPDFGVDEYVRDAGFVPDGFCLLLSAVDFVLQHPGMDRDTPLPPDACSREGHDHSRTRSRQAWTTYQVRGLVESLHARGCHVFLTVFAQCFEDRHHAEWATGHPENRALHHRIGRRGGINPLTRLKGGGMFEDLFLDRLVPVLDEYGFDGWHGADGWGPLSGAIYDVDFSDDMAGQFSDSSGLDLPGDVSIACGDDMAAVAGRAEWIWRHCREKWIHFYADRWAAFWRKAAGRIHAAGKQCFINSAWGRGPFESLYRYGIDYRKIAEAGVDGMIVETVAAGLSMDPRCGDGDVERHYDFLSTLMLNKACAPGLRMIHLLNVHDVVEAWDVLRHAPTVLEKDIYSLANVYLVRGRGRSERCAAGLLACLGDAIAPDEWRWLHERWDVAWSEEPVRLLGATLVWSDAVMEGQTASFTADRTAFTHRALYPLMSRGAPVQAVVRIEDLDAADGALLVINPNLLPEAEAARISEYNRGPVIAIGPFRPSWGTPALCFGDVHEPHAMQCCVFGGEGRPPVLTNDEPEQLPDDLMGLIDLPGYWDYLFARKVSDSFLRACADAIVNVSGAPRVVEEADAVTLMAAELQDGRVRVAVKNQRPVYLKPSVDVGRPIATVEILTDFPQTPADVADTHFRVRVPGTGIVVADVRLA